MNRRRGVGNQNAPKPGEGDTPGLLEVLLSRQRLLTRIITKHDHC